MNKVLSTTERNRRKYKNIYQSFEKKLNGENLIWWNSLTHRAKYSVIFKWIKYRVDFKNKHKKDPKVKYFILNYKMKYKPHVSMYRQSVIDHILKNSESQLCKP
jgi:hypothetical protein